MSLELREAQERLLAALVEHRGNLDAARKASGVSKAEFYNWIESDEAFVTRYDKYMLMLGTEVEAEAVTRVMNPGGNRGSDALLGTVLKGLKRSRYGEPDKAAGVTVVVWNSQLRDQPRPGAEVVVVDGVRAVDGEPAALPAPVDQERAGGDADVDLGDHQPDQAPVLHLRGDQGGASPA